MVDLLLEIGLEEIPARMIAGAEAELGRRVSELLVRERLLDSAGKLTTYSTPRRLAIHVEGLATSQPDTEEQLIGPSWKIAFPNSKDGNDEPGPAAIAFANKAGVAVSALEKITNAKGEYLGAKVKRKGLKAAELLTAELPKEVLALYWAKNMYWRANKPERFVRPVRWLVALLDSAVIPLEIAGIAAANTSRGHRILHGDEPVVIGEPSAYLEALRAAFVDADVAARRHSIRKALDRVTREISETTGARWREDHELVETVVHLTEWPTVLYGSFESEYLSLPEEVLVTVMRDHQKYFAVEDANGKLAPHFLTVLNTQVDEEGRAIIRHGNERVLRSRFKDAQFFWETDQKIPLTARVEMLKSVTFQKKLGSYHWKTEENLAVVQRLAESVTSAGAGISYKLDLLNKAVELAKTDLTTELVKEFTELQGVVGGLYAKAQGEDEAIAQAIGQQYLPASIEDQIPTTIEGQLLGVADRIQTITAMFGIGNAPTGSKDPFALRRAANAIVKILAESSLPLTLGDVVAASGADLAVQEQVSIFLRERLNFYLKDVCGFAYDVVNAVTAVGADDVSDAIKRAEDVSSERGSADFIATCTAFKRIKNILRQVSENGEAIPLEAPSETALVEAEEKALLKAARSLASQVTVLQKNRDYRLAIERTATLGPVVAAFFDKVMVQAPDPELRAARLGLINTVIADFSRIADFSEIVIA